MVCVLREGAGVSARRVVGMQRSRVRRRFARVHAHGGAGGGWRCLGRGKVTRRDWSCEGKPAHRDQGTTGLALGAAHPVAAGIALGAAVVRESQSAERAEGGRGGGEVKNKM